MLHLTRIEGQVKADQVMSEARERGMLELEL